ncbi:hypothetical protein [Streptomyces deccanensis]|uniref:hypothetical protein n=1 Tax=Streptomyces deccanensis TaxID=424188 RepID=UPI001EFBCF27|nr:hypothetical protein [Streptomyces deccanensis]ULR55643.1 hypothetical protein L3078_43670 [Streptomyces deccanensis]
MSMRIRTSALTALAVVALAAGSVLTAPAAGAASKAAAPKFLSASQLPPHASSAWTAGPVKEGVPASLDLCFHTENVADYVYRHREFRTDVDTNAVQLTVVASTPALAKGLAKHYDDLFRICADRLEAGSPDVDTEGRDYGTLPVEEGAHVRGVNVETSGGANDVALMSVGRDGRTVTVVQWQQLGDFTGAPVAAFKKTTTTAVNKLY